MGRVPSLLLFLAAAPACNAIFGLDPVQPAGAGGAAGTGGDGAGGGAGTGGAAGAAGGTGGGGAGSGGGGAGSGGSLLGGKDVYVAVGRQFACAVQGDPSTGKLFCWGENNEGQVAVPLGGAVGEAPGEMGEDLEPFAFANALPNRIAAGEAHVCAKVIPNGGDQEARCWGDKMGNSVLLGGSSPAVSMPVPMNKSVLRVFAGWTHTCLQFNTYQASC